MACTEYNLDGLNDGILLQLTYCTKVHFASFLSRGFITVIVENPQERKLVKHTYLYCEKNCYSDQEKLLKFEAEGREFTKCLRLLKQFI